MVVPPTHSLNLGLPRIVAKVEEEVVQQVLNRNNCGLQRVSQGMYKKRCGVVWCGVVVVCQLKLQLKLKLTFPQNLSILNMVLAFHTNQFEQLLREQNLQSGLRVHPQFKIRQQVAQNGYLQRGGNWLQLGHQLEERE